MTGKVMVEAFRSDAFFVMPERFYQASTEEDVFPSSVVFVFQVFIFLIRNLLHTTFKYFYKTVCNIESLCPPFSSQGSKLSYNKCSKRGGRGDEN